MKIEYTKELIESLINQLGKDNAIEELMNSFRIVLMEHIVEIENEKD